MLGTKVNGNDEDKVATVLWLPLRTSLCVKFIIDFGRPECWLGIVKIA